VYHLLLVHTIKRAHSSGQMLAIRPARGKNGVHRTITDKLGQTVDFLLTAHRDVAAARRYFERAIDLHDVPQKITIDKSGANTAVVRGLVADSGLTIELRQ